MVVLHRRIRSQASSWRGLSERTDAPPRTIRELAHGRDKGNSLLFKSGKGETMDASAAGSQLPCVRQAGSGRISQLATSPVTTTAMATSTGKLRAARPDASTSTQRMRRASKDSCPLSAAKSLLALSALMSVSGANALVARIGSAPFLVTEYLA